MIPVLKVFLSILCKLRSAKGFIRHRLRRWALLLAFLGRRLGVWRLWGDGTVAFGKAERAEDSFCGIRTQREHDVPAVVAASYVPASATASQYHVLSDAQQLAPPAPAHLTAGPYREYAYPRSALDTQEPSREQATAVPPTRLHRAAHGLSPSLSREPLLRSPSPADSFQLHPLSSNVHAQPIPPSIEGQSLVNVVVAIESPLIELPLLRLSVNATLALASPRVVLKPMNPDQSPRYTRHIMVPRESVVDYKIKPLTMAFPHVPERIRPEQDSPLEDCAPWVSATHPDGALYFFDPVRRLFTDTDMHEPVLRREMGEFYQYLQRILDHNGIAIPSQSYDLVLDIMHAEDGQMQWSYYYACHKSRCLFWLEAYDAEYMLSEVSWVRSPAHVKHRLEALYWSHWSLYPAVFEDRRLERAVYDELVGILSHGCMDVMTSKSSTLPYDNDTMQKMLGLVQTAKEADSNSMYHTAAVTRLLSFFAHWRFLYFHGQNNARLDKHRTVYSKTKRRRTLFISLLSPVLFLAPEVHLQEIKKLWTDDIIIDAAWKSFVPKLLEEWQELILFSTVMLSANVGFLAIPGVAISNLNSNITGASDVRIFTSPAQIASYMSMEASVGSIVIGLLLVRHNRSKQKEDPAGALNYLNKYTHSRFGLEPMAIIFSLPWALLMWAMAMFFIALMLVCFRISNLPTRIFVAVTSVMVAVLIGWCTLWSWRSGDSGKLWFDGLPAQPSVTRALGVTRAFGDRLIRLIPRRAHQSSPA